MWNGECDIGMSVDMVALYGKVMENWYKDNPPTQAKINSLKYSLGHSIEYFDDLRAVLVKWHFAETLMRNDQFMYCKDIEDKLKTIIEDSRKDRRFRSTNLDKKYHTDVNIMSLQKQSENPVEATIIRKEMGVPIKKMNVTDEEARNIIKAGLGNKLVGKL